MKLRVVLIGFVSGGGMLLVGYFFSNSYFQQVAVSLSCVLIGLSVGILTVNTFLEKYQNQKILRISINAFSLSFENIDKYFTELLWDSFGAENSEKILQDFHKGGGNILAISKESRSIISSAFLERRKKFDVIIDEVDFSLNLFDSTADFHLHNWIIKSKDCVRKYKILGPKDVNEGTSAIQALFDVYYSTEAAHKRLNSIIGNLPVPPKFATTAN